MTQYELESRSITADGIGGVAYRFGDLIIIKSGDFSGQKAVVVSLLSIDPEPIYVLELPSGHSAVLSECELEPTGFATGGTLKLRRPGSLPD